MIHKGHLYILLSIFLLTSVAVFSQDEEVKSNPYIEYVGQFPDESDEKLKQKFGKRLVNFLIGKKYENVVSKPVSVFAKNMEDVWILDQGNQALINFNKGVGEMPQFKSKKYENFPSLVGICQFNKEKILFTDSYYNRVFIITPGKKELNELNDTISYQRPTGLCYDAENKQIWIVETNAHRVGIYQEDGTLIKKIGERGDGAGQFNFPTSICIDHYGKVFIVDAMNFRVQVFSPDGELLTIFGKQGDATGHFARPKGIATDSEGNVYVVDALFNTVQIFDVHGNFLENFGSHGRGEGEFWMPNGIFIDDEDYIYVADTYNARVQVFRLVKGKK